MKKPKTVIDAQAALATKTAEIAVAKDALKRLEQEHLTALLAVRQAQTEADASLPQCRLVRLRWRSNDEKDMGRVVILRRTPGGMLVVRHIGETDGYEYKFKWSGYTPDSSRFRQINKVGYASDVSELRDVPSEYQP